MSTPDVKAPGGAAPPHPQAQLQVNVSGSDSTLQLKLVDVDIEATRALARIFGMEIEPVFDRHRGLLWLGWSRDGQRFIIGATHELRHALELHTRWMTIVGGAKCMAAWRASKVRSSERRWYVGSDVRARRKH